jgi:hypothetical protein
MRATSHCIYALRLHRLQDYAEKNWVRNSEAGNFTVRIVDVSEVGICYQ